MRMLRYLWAAVIVLSTCGTPATGREFYVSPGGKDTSPGTREEPFATLARARDAVRRAKAAEKGPIRVYLRGGTYYLSEPVVFTPEDSGTKDAPIVYQACEGEQSVLSGGVRLDLKWTAHKDGIMKAEVPAAAQGKLAFTQLFVNGGRQPLARYPNYDPNRRPFGGVAPDAISPERVKRWANPVGAFVHALQHTQWGSVHYTVIGVDDNGRVKLKGGDQNNRDPRLHPNDRFVENVFEELDAPGEWYLDAKTLTLYFMPPRDLDLSGAKVEAAVLRQLIELRGSPESPVRDLQFKGLTFTHTACVFAEPYEKLLRGDWAIHRSGAFFMEGTEDCAVVECVFDQVGGNAVFVNHYNRRGKVADCRIFGACESGVCLVGDPNAVRCPSTWQKHLREIPDSQSGPKTSNYPSDCVVSNNDIHHIGRIGKQTAGVFISMSERITASHNSIHDVPRAGICINDGTWGGHVIEFNDIYDTVQETGDHGPVNSWGRDRYWTSGAKDAALLDARTTTHVRNNRIHGQGNWGIDLDDGSSNYHVYNNLCLGLGIKLREGYFRRMENNILVGGPGHFHVWYKDCEDVVARNIIVCDAAYMFIRANPAFAKEFDYNLFYNHGRQVRVEGVGPTMTLEQWQQKGFDRHSIAADPMFIDPDGGDYRVKDESPALKLGFKNFPMDQFGVITRDHVPGKIVIRANVKQPAPGAPSGQAEQPRESRLFMGATITNIYSDGIESATALGDRNGVYVQSVPAGSAAAKAAFKAGDVILAFNGKAVNNMDALMRMLGDTPGGRSRPGEDRLAFGGRKIEITVYRNQKRETLSFPSPTGVQPDVHLADLQWKKALTGYREVGKDQCAWEAEPQLNLLYVPYRRGLGLHATADVAYELEPRFKRFVGRVGIHQRYGGNSGSVVAQVLIDGKPAKESPLLKGGQEPFDFDVPIPPGSKEIRLVVTDGGDGNHNDLVDWVNVGFLVRDETK